MADTLTIYPSPSWRLLSSTFYLLAVVVLAFCVVRRRPFRILPKPHALKLDASVALQHVNHPPQPSPALPPLHKSVPPLQALTASLRARLSAFHVVTTFTRFTSWAVVFMSFVFAFTVTIFATGVGLDRSIQNMTPMTDLQPTMNCRGAIYASVILYMLTKLFVYMFLIERVHVVSSAGQQPCRFSTGIYRSGLAAMCIYIVIFAFIIHGCVVELAPPWWSTEPSPTVCTIGLKGYATIPLLIYDAVTSIALTIMFVIPLVTVGRVDPHLAGVEQGTVSPEAISPRAQENFNVPAMTEPPALPSSEKARASGTGNATEAMEAGSFLHQWGRMHRERLHSLAKKSCLATVAALVCSTVNIIVLIRRQGRETGWIFLLWSTLDVTVNALAVFFMTTGSVDQDHERRPSAFDVGPSTYPLTAVTSNVPAVCTAGLSRLSWMHNPGVVDGRPDSPPSGDSTVLPAISPREPKRKLSRRPTANYHRGPVVTLAPSPKTTPQARGSFASAEQVHLKLHQPRGSAESGSSEGRVIRAKINTQEDVVEEHSAMGDLSSHWWTPSSPVVIPEGVGENNSRIRMSDPKIDASSGPAFSQWWIRDSRAGSKRWSLPH